MCNITAMPKVLLSAEFYSLCSRFLVDFCRSSIRTTVSTMARPPARITKCGASVALHLYRPATASNLLWLRFSEQQMSLLSARWGEENVRPPLHSASRQGRTHPDQCGCILRARA